MSDHRPVRASGRRRLAQIRIGKTKSPRGRPAPGGGGKRARADRRASAARHRSGAADRGWKVRRSVQYGGRAAVLDGRQGPSGGAIVCCARLSAGGRVRALGRRATGVGRRALLPQHVASVLEGGRLDSQVRSTDGGSTPLAQRRSGSVAALHKLEEAMSCGPKAWVLQPYLGRTPGQNRTGSSGRETRISQRIEKERQLGRSFRLGWGLALISFCRWCAGWFLGCR